MELRVRFTVSQYPTSQTSLPGSDVKAHRVVGEMTELLERDICNSVISDVIGKGVLGRLERSTFIGHFI